MTQPPGPGWQPPGPPGPPGPGSAPKRSLPTWWIGPYLIGAVVVLVVFAILQLTVLNGSAKSGSASPSSTVLIPAQMFPDPLFKRLTTDIQGHNEKDFMSLVSPGAQPAVQTWWENMQAMGYSTGLIMPTDKSDQVNLDPKGDGTTVALAGTHNALDPLDNDKKPDVPLERYQIGLHFSAPKAIGQITSWKPLGNAPWDQGKLYVRKAADVEVVGQASESSVVDETLPIAQAAADYDTGLINHVHPADLRQEGFVVFVSGDPAVRNRWFTTTKQPSGWPPAQSSGLTAQLPGPGASADQNWPVGNIAQDTTGGARVIITPFEDQSGGTKQVETAELVTRFAIDILSASNQALLPGEPSPSIPDWASEGFGVAFEAAYYGNTNPAPGAYTFKVLNDDLKKLPASYKTGDLPTADELYNDSSDVETNWRLVAGSVYAYIATRAGMGQMLGSAELMWTQFADPRGNVLKSTDGKGTFTFFDKNTIVSGWKAYLKNPVDQAPPIGPSGV